MLRAETRTLSGAKLCGAILSGALFPGAGLYGANLYSAMLTGADLTGYSLVLYILGGREVPEHLKPITGIRKGPPSRHKSASQPV